MDMLSEAKKFIFLGEWNNAENMYKKCLKIDSTRKEALHGLSLICFRQKKYAEAERYLLLAIALEPEDPELHSSLAKAYLDQKKWEKALLSYISARKCCEAKKGVCSHARYTSILLHLAELYILQQRPKEAKSVAKKILLTDPKNVLALKILAQSSVAGHQFNEAITYIKMMPLAPAIKKGSIAEVLLMKGELKAAIDLTRQSLRQNPYEIEVYLLLAECYIKKGEFYEAKKTITKGLAIDPNHPRLLGRLLALKIRICEWDGRESVVEKLKALYQMLPSGKESLFQMSQGDKNLEAIPPTTAILAGFSNEELCKVSKAKSERLEIMAAPVRETLKFTFSRSKRKKRIRVGYLSADFHDHATAHLMLDLFGLHDREKFTVHAFSYGKNDRSEYRKKIQKDCDSFTDISRTSDKDAAKKIFTQEIDVLVDLKGHIVDSRLGILALRPAPIQVHYLGYPGTIGASFVDYLIADRYVIPKSERKYYSEAIVYMPDTYQINMANKKVLAVPSRKEYGLPDNSFVFCCFNQNDKLDPQSVSSWMEILKEVPNSVLWLWGNYSELKKKLHIFGKKFGIKKERLIVCETEPNPRHLSRMRLADLFLDTFYYNAHTSCSDAIRMGLPVLTWPGKTFASRVAASLLCSVNEKMLIANTRESYIAKAIQLAKNRTRLRKIKANIDKNRVLSHLYDSQYFTSLLEKGYLSMWQRHLEGKAPKDIYTKL